MNSNFELSWKTLPIHIILHKLRITHARDVYDTLFEFPNLTQ